MKILAKIVEAAWTLPLYVFLVMESTTELDACVYMCS